MRAVPSAASAKKPSPLNSETMHPSKGWEKISTGFFRPLLLQHPERFFERDALWEI